MKKLSLIMALIICISCFSGCVFHGLSNPDNLPSNNKKSITKFIQEKYPDDTITFLKKGEYEYRDSAFGTLESTKHIYQFHSHKYDTEFRVIYHDKGFGETDEVYDTYQDLEYFTEIKREIKSALGTVGDCQFWFSPACLHNYCEREVNTKEEWFNTMNCCFVVLFKEMPEDMDTFEEALRQAFYHSELSSLHSLWFNVYFGNNENNVSLLQFIFEDFNPNTTWDLFVPDFNSFSENLDNIEPYILHYDQSFEENEVGVSIDRYKINPDTGVYEEWNL